MGTILCGSSFVLSGTGSACSPSRLLQPPPSPSIPPIHRTIILRKHCNSPPHAAVACPRRPTRSAPSRIFLASMHSCLSLRFGLRRGPVLPRGCMVLGMDAPSIADAPFLLSVKSLDSHSSKQPSSKPKSCVHGKAIGRCKECGGSRWCVHQRQRSQCKECGGSGICSHMKVRSRCRECGGGSICQHGLQKSRCKDCGGVGICHHGRVKSKCKDCFGGSICVHGRRKCYCKECGGGSICVHGRRKCYCKECDGSGLCPHKRMKSKCKDCGGGSICAHQKLKSRCKICKSSAAASSTSEQQALSTPM